MKLVPMLVLILFTNMQIAAATTFYVKPGGDDAADGKSIDHAWQSCAKVNAATFQAGDTILFQRGGQWRESLNASFDGTAGSPITYDAFGDGAKPTFFGSDKLDNSKFAAAGSDAWTYPLPAQADSALADHVFIKSQWKDGTLTITQPSDPRNDGKLYTACTRGNTLFSNRKNHLVFRNLIVDETAGQLNEGPNQGYGVRIEGSTDVLLEDCEAYRVGRHHFAVINSTEFIGRHLKAAYVVPLMPGANTAYVSYADAGAPVAHCTSVWDDIAADHLEDPAGVKNLPFVSHGDHQGLITIQNSSFNDKVSFMSAPAMVKNTTLHGTASIENFGQGIVLDGVRLLDSAAIDQYGSDGTIQNCIAHLTPSGGGPTGYGSAIVVRDKSKNNVIQFNTLVCGKFSCLCLAGGDSMTSWLGNIMLSDGKTVDRPAGALTKTDTLKVDYNFYNPSASFAGVPFVDWQHGGADQHSMTGEAKFVDAAKGDFKLQQGSACRGMIREKPPVPLAKDIDGAPRSADDTTIGAYAGS